jgi:hypothetical protein
MNFTLVRAADFQSGLSGAECDEKAPYSPEIVAHPIKKFKKLPL